MAQMLKNPPMEDRVDRFIKLYPKHNFTVYRAAMEAGYSETYARTNPRHIMETALKRMSLRTQSASKGELVEQKEVLTSVLDIVGMTSKEVKKYYRGVVEQTKDRATQLKALKPLLRELGVLFEEDIQPKTPVTFNLGIREGTIDKPTTVGDDVAAH
jgi:hypothetical protein